MLKSVANHEDPAEVLMAFQENTILHNDKYRKCDKNHIKDTYCVIYGGWQEHFTAIDSLEIQFTTQAVDINLRETTVSQRKWFINNQ
jgi:hypothetical protein